MLLLRGKLVLHQFNHLQFFFKSLSCFFILDIKAVSECSLHQSFVQLYDCNAEMHSRYKVGIWFTCVITSIKPSLLTARLYSRLLHFIHVHIHFKKIAYDCHVIMLCPSARDERECGRESTLQIASLTATFLQIIHVQDNTNKLSNHIESLHYHSYSLSSCLPSATQLQRSLLLISHPETKLRQ